MNNLKQFHKAQNLTFTLLSDVNGCIARRFGVPVSKGGVFKTAIDDREVVLKRAWTFARWTFLLDPDGKVIYKDTSVDASNDIGKALDFLRNGAYGPWGFPSHSVGCYHPEVRESRMGEFFLSAAIFLVDFIYYRGNITIIRKAM